MRARVGSAVPRGTSKGVSEVQECQLGQALSGPPSGRRCPDWKGLEKWCRGSGGEAGASSSAIALGLIHEIRADLLRPGESKCGDGDGWPIIVTGFFYYVAYLVAMVVLLAVDWPSSRSEFADVFAVSAGIAAGIAATIEILLRIFFWLAPQVILEQGRQEGEKRMLDRLEGQSVITPKQRLEAEEAI